MILKIPLHDQFAILVDVNMSWRVIASPCDENVVAAPNLANPQTLPHVVTFVKKQRYDRWTACHLLDSGSGGVTFRFSGPGVS